MKKKLFVYVLVVLITFSSLGILPYASASTYMENFEYTNQEDAKSSLLTYWDFSGLKPFGEADGNKVENGALILKFADGLRLTWKNKLETYEFKADVKGAINTGHSATQSISFRTTKTDYFGMTVYEQTNSDSTTGFSGVVVKLNGDKIYIYVKKFDETNTYSSSSTQNKPTYAGHEYIEINVPNGKNTAEDFVNVHVTDDGSTMTIKINNTLCATVAMSEINDVTLHDTNIGQYYTKAVLTNAITNEAKTVMNARISYNDATIAFGTRNGARNMYIDNIYLDEDYELEQTNPQTDDHVCFVSITLSGLIVLVLLKRKMAY